MKARDFKVTETGGLFIDPIKKDFVIADSDPQHIKELLMGVQGWIKEFPLVGFNPYSRINSRISKQANIRDATLTLQGDGYTKGVGGIKFTLTPNGEFLIDVLDVYRK